MLDDVKDAAKDKARLMGTTLTDLINDAVEYYINNLDDIDPEAARKQLGREIRDQPKINQMEKEIQELKDKLNKMQEVDNEVDGLRNEIDQLKQNMEGEYIQSIVRTHIDAKVGKTLEDLQQILQRLG